MKLFGTVAVHVAAEAILRAPGLWEKVRRAFGGDPDLTTGRMRAALEASAVVDGVRDALRSLGATNAVSLVVDDLVLFQDKDGRPDDLGDLFLAFHEQSDAIGGGFALLRLAVEHVEAGLHLVIEVQARTEHAPDEPAVRVVVSGRLRDLEPRKGEDAETYRTRVEPLTRDRTTIDVAKLQFDSFVARVKEAIAAAMPEARAEVVTSEARIARPGKRAAAAPAPTAPGYDPYDAYYPSPMGDAMNMMMWASIFSMPSHPHVVVVNDVGNPVGTTDTPGIEHADPDVGGDAGGDVGADVGGDVGADVGDVGGGDFGGGDFGGFD